MAQRVGGAVELPGEQAVQDEEVRHAGAAQGGILTPRDGEGLGLDGEPVLEEEGEEEDGHGDPDEGEHHGAVVDARPVALGCHVPQRDREHDGDRHRDDAQFDGRRKPGEEDLERVTSGKDGRRGAEVTLGGALEELQVLHVHRLVEAERLLEGGS